MTMSPAAESPRFPGRVFLLLGPALAVLGIVGFVVRMSLQRLEAPWYMPGLATLGVAFVVLSLAKKRTLWRGLVLVLVTLLAGAEWAVMLAMRLPAYAGPIAAGRAFPAFTTARADGTPFTQQDLEGDQNSVLVFFRGRW